MICIEISKGKYLPFGTNPKKPQSKEESSSSSKPISRRAMITMGGPSHAVESTLGVVLEEFFKAERSENDDV